MLLSLRFASGKSHLKINFLDKIELYKDSSTNYVDLLCKYSGIVQGCHSIIYIKLVKILCITLIVVFVECCVNST